VLAALLVPSVPVLAITVNSPADYLHALGGNHSVVSVTDHTTLAAKTPANVLVSGGFVLEGQYGGSGPTVEMSVVKSFLQIS